MPGVVSLITDVEKRYVYRNSEVAVRESVIAGVDLPYSGASWNWLLVPQLKDDPDFCQQRLVVGITDVKRARRGR